MAKTYEPVGWQNATQIKPATVVIDGTEYEVTPELMSGTTPINATNLKHMDDAIKDLYDGGASTTDIVISPEEPTTEDWKIWIDTDEVNNLGSEVVDTLDGNEANKAPSVRAVNKLNTYSTEDGQGGSSSGGSSNVYSTTETAIGTWIDGKPLYRKVFTGTKVSGSNTTINISELNVDHIYFYGSITGNADGSGGTYEFPLNYYETSTAYIRVNLHRKYSNFTIKSSDGTYFNGTFNLIIEYTKTTDTATSTLSEVTE